MSAAAATRRTLAGARSLSPVLLLLACASACDDGPSGEPVELVAAPVRGGVEAPPGAWPAVAVLDVGCSAVLVHPEIVLYAAHCGSAVARVSFGDRRDQPLRVAVPRRCEAAPEAALGNGRDLAYCLLAEPVVDAEPIPVAAGAEIDRIVPGTVATLVGFGADRDGGPADTKRSGDVVLSDIGRELLLDTDQIGACAGDSGAPLLIDVAARAAGEANPRAYRVAGIVSSSENARCGPGTEHAVPIAPLIPWLERASGRALRPAPAPVVAGCAVGARAGGARRAPTPQPSPPSVLLLSIAAGAVAARRGRRRRR